MNVEEGTFIFMHLRKICYNSCHKRFQELVDMLRARHAPFASSYRPSLTIRQLYPWPLGPSHCRNQSHQMERHLRQEDPWQLEGPVGRQLEGVQKGIHQGSFEGELLRAQSSYILNKTINIALEQLDVADSPSGVSNTEATPDQGGIQQHSDSFSQFLFFVALFQRVLILLICRRQLQNLFQEAFNER